MKAATVCPDEAQLRRHLAGALAAEEAELVAHLDRCVACQRSLDLLAAGSEQLLRTAREVGRRLPESEPGLGLVLARLAGIDSRPDASEATVELAPRPRGTTGRLGHFAALEEIGRGGMGIVYRAFDELLHRVVAIKVLAPRLAQSPAARRRFLQEARAAAAIRHDHVVSIYAIEEAADPPYLVMEHLEGGSLQQRLDHQGACDLKEALRLARHIALGLAAAHERGVVHRDIKPANVLLDATSGRAKLTDFGLACAVAEAGLAASGVIVGTPQYMAPEQARGEAVDHRADLFSFGSLLYALCTGRGPFQAEDTRALLHDVQSGQPRPVEERGPPLPGWLVALIGRLHAPRPDDRFDSAAEVAELLRRKLEELERPSRRQVLIATASVLAAATGLGAWVTWHRRAKTAPTNLWPPSEPASSRRVLLVLPSRDFHYPQYISVRSMLVNAGVAVVVAAPTTEPVEPDRDYHPEQPAIRPALSLATVNGASYDAVYFPGGKGITELCAGGPHAADARRVIAEALSAQRVVAALGDGPVVLADAGALKGRRATCDLFGQPPGTFVLHLQEAGAIWVDEPVVTHDRVITGQDPKDAHAFARALLRQLGKK